MTEKENLMKKIQLHDFALVEIVLYLDGHPDNKSAIKYFNKQQELKTKYINEYESKYGPITTDFDYDNHWDWVSTPWPWELED